MSIFQNFLKNKTKKLIIFSLPFLSLLILLIFLFYHSQPKESENAKIEDYIFEERENKKLLINKKDGIEIEIPDGWEMVKGMEFGGSLNDKIITFFTSDFGFKPIQGCAIELSITRFKGKTKDSIIPSSPEAIKDLIEKEKNIPENQKNPKESIIKIKDFEAIQEIQNFSKSEIARQIYITLPTKTRVINFFVSSFSPNCQEKLDDFFNKIIIENK